VEVFSQEEIDGLLTAINAGPAEPEDFRPAPGTRKIRIYDFNRPDKFTKEHIRVFSRIHEKFSWYSTTSLSALLCSLVHIHVASVDQLTYEEFIRSIPTPTTLGTVKMSPFKGNAVIEIDPAITFSIIDRLMGGTGEGTKSQHELTSIETAVMEEVLFLFLDDLQKAWKQIIDLKPELIAIDTNPQFVQISPLNEMVILVTLDAKVGDVEGMINIAFPYDTVESELNNISNAGCNGRYKPNTVKNYQLRNRSDIPVKITAEILRRNFPIQEINKWKEGTILTPLYPIPQNTCYMRLADRYVWQCEIMPDNKSYPKSVKISDFVKDPFGTERMENMEKINPAVTDALQAAKINVTVELGSTSRSINDLYSLDEGSILELDNLVGEPLDVKANGILIAKGEAVVIDEKFGIRITEILKPQQPAPVQEN